MGSELVAGTLSRQCSKGGMLLLQADDQAPVCELTKDAAATGATGVEIPDQMSAGGVTAIVLSNFLHTLHTL
jgi:hypothetical protein